uniref:Cytochrome b n=1 Tax=Contracaecum osculatum TaxID=106324 RepID=A0A023HTT3_CONOS|nr:cytochrome b [Contracaecum osculatum]AGR53830.1 cytochrome b [Contracaecum osculatum]
MKNGVFNFFNSLVISLPSSKALTLNWNYGSMLGMVLGFQILTGTLLAFYYTNDGVSAFSSVQYIMYEVNYGWVFRIFHSNGASLFFIFLYLHIFKGLFFCSYRLKKVWLTGVVILLLVMMEAFMGYVLVWAQMSFWASVVITSLLSVIPFWGVDIVTWIWSGFTVSSATLKFFFVVHFLVPWGLLVVVLVHLLMLHITGSTSKLYCHGDYDKISFFPGFWVKDAYNLLIWLGFFVFVFIFPFNLGDPEMFIEADPMVSPAHIVPEWYFLYAYAILRAIPNKVLGVVAMFASQMVLFSFLFVNNYVSLMFKVNKFLVFCLLFILVMLSWLGQCLVEDPFVGLSFWFSVLYFLVFFILLSVFFVTKLIFK